MTGPQEPLPETASIWVEQRLPGFHRWPEAPPERDFLASRHRHLFRVRVDVLVAHDERDLEFFDVADLIREWWGPGEHEFGPASCEAMARGLGQWLIGRGLPVAETSVAADDEGGSRLVWRTSPRST
ncbi:hypothetical protein [Streptomyces sp. NPDC006879]|uniref:hypothetical protein n=1 Tax=Streptomyces sp. NPDC006879 TaxID=3364767 RepID=UPI00368B3C4F